MQSPSPLPVVLTRSRADNARLAAALRAHGVPVLLWPALRTRLLRPVTGPALLALLRAADVVVFTSRRGVLATRALAGRGLAAALAEPRRVAAVGEGTAALLRRLGPGPGPRPGLEPAWLGESGADALTASLSAPGALPAGARVLLLRGAEASDVPPRSLREAGLIVDDLRVYAQEAPPPPACAPCELGAVVCASPSAARRVVSWHSWVLAAPFIAIGATTAAALHDLGAPNVLIARRPDPSSLCEAVLDALASRGTT